MKGPTADLVSQATCAALIDAVRTWRQEYAPASPYEGLMGAAIKEVHIQTNIRKIERVDLTITVKGLRPNTSDIYWYHAHFLAGELKLETYS